MADRFSRTQMLLGREAMDILAASKVAVFGVGGVGGYVCEALSRSGVGAFDITDGDRICLANVNRQIIATEGTVGLYKAEVMKNRILEINPSAFVTARTCFFLPENADEFPFEEYSYVVDAVDTVTAKIEIVTRCLAAQTPVISAMGAGGKLDPTKLKVADIYDTETCPLARVMRRELKKRGVESLKTVYSNEPVSRAEMAADRAGVESLKTVYSNELPERGEKEEIGGEELSREPLPGEEYGRQRSASPLLAAQSAKKDAPPSAAFVPCAMGLIIASEVVRDLTARGFAR